MDSSGTAQASTFSATTSSAVGQPQQPASTSITVTTGDGSVTLSSEDLQMLLLAIQTFLLVYVTYKESMP